MTKTRNDDYTLIAPRILILNRTVEIFYEFYEVKLQVICSEQWRIYRILQWRRAMRLTTLVAKFFKKCWELFDIFPANKFDR
jgi:hypothetical protein